LRFAESATHLALTAVTATSWFGLGWVVLARVRRTGDVLLDTLNRVGVGAVAFALLTLGAAAAGGLYTVVYVPFLVVCAAVGLIPARRIARDAPRPRIRSWPRWQIALAVLIVASCLLTAVATCAPVTTFDALHYHAAAPARYAEAHKLLEFEWGWSTYQPFTVEMLATDGVLLEDSVQGAFASYLLGLFALTAVVGMGLRTGGRPTALLAAATFALQPLLAFEESGSLIETGLAFVVALAAWNGAVYVVHRDLTALVLCGAFAGAAAGMKYVGLFVPIAVAVGLLVALRGRMPHRAALAFVVPAVLVGLPWYVKNALQTGNPLFPFVFGGVTDEARRFIEGGIREHGTGRSPSDAALLPFRLLADGDAFDRGSWLSPLPLLFAPLALLDARTRRVSVPVLAGAAAFLAAWFATSQQARFLIAVAPVLSVLAALGMQALARRGSIGRLVATTVTAAALSTGFAMIAVYTAQFLPVAVGAEGRDEFLEVKTPYYDGVRRLNRLLDDNDRVLLDFAAVLYVEDPYVVWTPLVLSTDADPAEALRFAAAEGLTHAAVLEVNHEARQPTLDALGARLIATVPVHAPVFGLRITRGPPERLHIYELAEP
jgi:hypothetical protein